MDILSTGIIDSIDAPVVKREDTTIHTITRAFMSKRMSFI
jgi:hypothetical protein